MYLQIYVYVYLGTIAPQIYDMIWYGTMIRKLKILIHNPIERTVLEVLRSLYLRALLRFLLKALYRAYLNSI